MSSNVVRISIVSDVVCPWCYVGIAQLQKAMSKVQQSHPSVSFDLRWQAFELNPDLDKASSTSAAPETVPVVSKVDYLAWKFGSIEVLEKTRKFLEQRAQAAGVQINGYGGVIGPTKLVHEALVYAGEKEKQTEFMLALFEAYFGRSENIFDMAGILKVSATVDRLDVAELREYISTRNGRKIVEDEIKKNRYVGGVPHYTIGKYEVHGGQDVDTFVKVLELAM
ncbi:DSBA-like thioredoxin domain-containing protein [Lipomyces tetrasporus]|uniref:DSBA-like thioredoxin domain-containing protein n=1 Tax=Lipomyces tetrasporus TaxID=54092 RepID=A0AAD7VUM0_9ASCO|nr:DSBA-like thioredoxin domain-containing protein [Lipomyces tetrasporus]KAJ8102593.1 DSBA-like thioredoxin domain-containing protein [Lipomyces tetrasporus]